MPFRNEDLIKILPGVDLGTSVAESDALLESARVETSAFADLLNDRVDLVPGTKGSGKSALYRIFVEFLPDFLLKQRKAVIAHGVNRPGDNVFQAFNREFEQLEEGDFVNFWCIYIVSLVQEQFIKNPRYKDALANCGDAIRQFNATCAAAGIPDIPARKSLRDVLAWALTALKAMSPKLKYKPPGDVGEVELTLFGSKAKLESRDQDAEEPRLPRYTEQLKDGIEAILEGSGLNIWFMIDKLDEIFPRRSALERKALRALLRTMRVFTSPRMRVKIFLRDDMLSEIVGGGEGFVALTHVTAKQADTLRWSEDQILTMVVKRLFSSAALRTLLGINIEQLDANLEYRRESFYKVFPPQVHKGPSQSNTLRWIYTHTADGNGVVTPRDVIDLLTRAKQYEYDALSSDPSGTTEFVIGPGAIRYGLEELSKHKRDKYLYAEFPHLQPSIKKFIGGKTEYTERTLQELLGKDWQAVANDLVSIGLLALSKPHGKVLYRIPFLYRKGLDVTQGAAE